MRTVGTGFELRMCLRGNKPRVLRLLDHLHDMSVGGETAEAHAVLREDGTIVVVDLVAVAMALVDRFCSV